MSTCSTTCALKGGEKKLYFQKYTKTFHDINVKSIQHLKCVPHKPLWLQSLAHSGFWTLSHHCLQICSTYNLLPLSRPIEESKVKVLQGYWCCQAETGRMHPTLTSHFPQFLWLKPCFVIKLKTLSFKLITQLNLFGQTLYIFQWKRASELLSCVLLWSGSPLTILCSCELCLWPNLPQIKTSIVLSDSILQSSCKLYGQDYSHFQDKKIRYVGLPTKYRHSALWILLCFSF